ncbi:MAG: hypothetical protein K2X44_04720 [Magnetospirillum sp.]|nr:hypothetical protein [Magnetospirillum sp.]
MEDFNFISLGVTVVLALVGAPVLFRRSGYPFGKTVFGSLTVLFVMLGLWGITATIRVKTGMEIVPLGWLVPLAALAAAWRLQRQPS